MIKVEKVKRICGVCGKNIWAYPSEIKHGIKGKFCSLSCSAIHRTRRSLSVQNDEATDYLFGDD